VKRFSSLNEVCDDVLKWAARIEVEKDMGICVFDITLLVNDQHIVEGYKAVYGKLRLELSRQMPPKPLNLFSFCFQTGLI
jgi:hypothetical protein